MLVELKRVVVLIDLLYYLHPKINIQFGILYCNNATIDLFDMVHEVVTHLRLENMNVSKFKEYGCYFQAS